MIELLRSLDCDVVALNEVLGGGGHLARVAEELGMNHAYGEASWLGNALLSRRPLRDVETFQLARGHEEARSALVASIDGPRGGPSDVCATHLDVHREATRLDQLENLRHAMKTRAAPHLVMGDFNAVRLTDYTPTAPRRPPCSTSCQRARGAPRRRRGEDGSLGLPRWAPPRPRRRPGLVRGGAREAPSRR